ISSFPDPRSITPNLMIRLFTPKIPKSLDLQQMIEDGTETWNKEKVQLYSVHDSNQLHMISYRSDLLGTQNLSLWVQNYLMMFKNSTIRAAIAPHSFPLSLTYS